MFDATIEEMRQNYSDMLNLFIAAYTDDLTEADFTDLNASHGSAAASRPG